LGFFCQLPPLESTGPCQLPLRHMADSKTFEGRIPGFNNRWNSRKCETISKEDRIRWTAQDRNEELRKSMGKTRRTVQLPRAHSCIGPFPGCTIRKELSPRKASAMHFIEQKLQRSSSIDPDRPTVRETLYHGVTREEEGRYSYLNQRKRQTVRDRYGDFPPTTSMAYGFQRPEDEYRASVHCHKPIIEAGFFRVNGTMTHQNLPDSISK